MTYKNANDLHFNNFVYILFLRLGNKSLYHYKHFSIPIFKYPRLLQILAIISLVVVCEN